MKCPKCDEKMEEDTAFLKKVSRIGSSLGWVRQTYILKEKAEALS